MCVFKAEYDLELMSCKSSTVCFPLKGKRSPRNQLEIKSYLCLNISWFGECREAESGASKAAVTFDRGQK